MTSAQGVHAMPDDGGKANAAATDRTNEGSVWTITIATLIVLIVGLYLFLQSQSGKLAGDDAMVSAARDEAAAANKAGEAADGSTGT
jgi:hypothetical protein